MENPPGVFLPKLNKHVLPRRCQFRFSTERLWHRRASREHRGGGHRTLRQAQRGILRSRGWLVHGARGASEAPPLGDPNIWKGKRQKKGKP